MTTERAVPRAVLVPHDGSARAERALAHAVELCRETRACLGLVVIRRVLMLNAPLVCVAAPISEEDTCNALLRRLPDDISVRFLSCTYPASIAHIAEFARRLECDSVVLPYSGWRTRRAARVLARHGVAVLLEADGLPSPRPSRGASRPGDPLALTLPAALNPRQDLPNP
jgi:nucleotide-binding universal stress UspA family protein